MGGVSLARVGKVKGRCARRWKKLSSPSQIAWMSSKPWADKLEVYVYASEAENRKRKSHCAGGAGGG